MNEWPTLVPKRGLTEEEQRKVEAFIKSGRMKICPPPFSLELIAIGVARGRQWAETLTDAMKIKLGMVTLLRPERTEKEKRERKKEQEKAWHRKKKDKVKK